MRQGETRSLTSTSLTGATGARQIATAFNEAKRSGAKVIVTSMCAGTGFGIAGLFVNEQ